MRIMAEFKRGMDKLIEPLSKNDLFQNKLKPDIEAGQVFFAIRPGYGSFYVKGRSLFSYKNQGFSSHQKFAFIPDGIKNDYIFESQLDSLQAVKNFYLGYDRIKQRAVQYADIEAKGVSALYKYAPTTANLDGYYLVDIEIVFDAANDVENNDDDGKTDRIDILLYDNHTRQLLFCEAKHFSNPEIWASDGELPKVISQLEKYDQQITVNKKAIINQYTKAFSEYNTLMGTALNAPKSVFDKCGLYIFGFSREQQNELKKKFDAQKNFYGRRCRIIGDTRNDSVEKIYEAQVCLP